MPITFTSTPPPDRKITRATDAISQLPAFNDIYYSSYAYLDSLGLDTTIDNNLAAWRKDYREGIINVGGKMPDIDFFRHMVGGQSREIDATDYYIKYDGALDFNVYANADIAGTYGTVANAYYEQLQNGTYTGNYATFQPISDSYTDNGTMNNIFIGMGLHILNDGQEVTVIKIDKTTPYAWEVTVAPINGSYIPNIYARQAMAIRPSARTTGYSDVNSTFVNTAWATVGYVDKVQPMEFYRVWEQPMDLDMGYQDVVQFAFLFDNVTGQTVPTWYFKNANEARNDIMLAQTSEFFLGQRLTNIGLTANNYSAKFNGFDGLMPKLFYGGGNVYIYDDTYGFTLDFDYMNIVFANDAQKKSDELLMLNSTRFDWNFEVRNQDMIKNNPGACTFQTFQRMGDGGADLKRYNIRSFNWSSYTIHRRTVGAFSDQRVFGNNYIKDLAIILPGYGMTDSMGQPVGPVEYYRQKGTLQATEWSEEMVDFRKTPEMARKWGGNIYHRIQMAVHGVENMYAVMPQYVE